MLRRKDATIKFIPALCLGILLCIGCGEPNLNDPKVREKVLAEAMDASNLQTRQTPSGEKLRYAPNQEQPYTGWVKSGRSLAQFQRGKLHGFYITWYSNQQNSERGVFSGGRMDGLWTEWYENGQKSEEGPYKNDNRDGSWVFWHENGQKSSKGTYKNGIKDRLWTEWYADGVEQSKGNYKSGTKDGSWAKWYKNGQKSSGGTYKDGIKDGLWTEWYESGQKSEEGPYKNGNRDGSWVFWRENGQKSSGGTYKDGIKDGLWTEWYTDGVEQSKGNYKNGIKDGLWIEWYESGQKSGEGSYKNDNRDGSWVFWRRNGRKGSEGTYKNGIKNGLWTEWYTDGVEQSKGKYKNGIKDGLWIEWYTDGTEKLKIKPTDTEVVLIPAGEFQMGSKDGDSSEQPVHTVYVDALYMDIYEVTNAQYKKFVDANPQWRKDRIPRSYHNGNYLKHWNGNSYPSGKGNHPVVYVSWYAAMTYARWAGKRLPTEAEWEKAARGGLVGKKYPWGDSIDSNKANYGSNVGSTTAVGRYSPNGYGLYDMTGNVSEWCLDAYDDNFYKNSPRRNPVAGAGDITNVTNNITSIKNTRVLRGGSWYNGPKYVRVAGRGGVTPSGTSGSFGFRCARALPP